MKCFKSYGDPREAWRLDIKTLMSRLSYKIYTGDEESAFSIGKRLFQIAREIYLFQTGIDYTDFR